MDEPPTRDELRDAFRQVDVDRSGAVSFPEFYAWFNHSRNLCGNQNFTAFSTPSTRCLLDGVAVWVSHRSTEARPCAPDTLVDFHTQVATSTRRACLVWTRSYL